MSTTYKLYLELRQKLEQTNDPVSPAEWEQTPEKAKLLSTMENTYNRLQNERLKLRYTEIHGEVW